MHHKLGGWLPKDPKNFINWLHSVVGKVREDKRKGRLAKEHSSIQKFRNLIVGNTQVRMYFSLMFEQVGYHILLEQDFRSLDFC
jgi:phosphatidylserine decarboxylase